MSMVLPMKYLMISLSILEALIWVLKYFRRLCVLTLYIQLSGSFFETSASTAIVWTIFLMVFSLTPTTLCALWLLRTRGESSVISSGGVYLLPRFLSALYILSGVLASAC